MTKTKLSHILTATITTSILLAMVFLNNVLEPMGKRIEFVDIDAPPKIAAVTMQYNPEGGVCGSLRLHLKSGYFEITEPGKAVPFASGIMTPAGIGFFYNHDVTPPDTVCTFPAVFKND